MADYPNLRPAGAKGRPAVAVIDHELLIGEYPRPEDLPWLREEFGITAIHSLQDDFDLTRKGLNLDTFAEQCTEFAIEFARTPVADDYHGRDLASRFDDVLLVLGSLVADGHKVYLHCNGGINRAPTVAIAYMHVHKGLPLEEATTYVKERRNCLPYLHVLQMRFGAGNNS